ncbi:MAG: hypothetical protein ACYS67_18070 [Planctomycetota bacterium]
MAILILLNNFVHDFSAAGWLFGTVLLWSILRKTNLNGDRAIQVVDILKTVLVLMRFSVAGIVIFGVVRAIAYKSYEWNAAAGQSQVTLLIVKHVLFAMIFVVGLVYYIKVKKFVRKACNEQAV